MSGERVSVALKSLDLGAKKNFKKLLGRHKPAQISEGLEIQLLHLLLAEPVTDSTAFQEGLHLHCAASSLSGGEKRD